MVGGAVAWSTRAKASVKSINPFGNRFDGVGNIVNSVTGTSRGIRNNNPGNIRHGEAWQGRADPQTDPDFVQFVSADYGIRAMTKVLLTYSERYGLNTVRGIITRWAPPVENNTESYINSVAKRLGVDPDQEIDVRAYMAALVAAIIKHENGVQPYKIGTLNSGLILAGVDVGVRTV